MPIRVPKLRLIPYINKKDVGFCTRLSHRQALALPPSKDKQRISPRRAVYKQPLPMATRDCLNGDLKVVSLCLERQRKPSRP